MCFVISGYHLANGFDEEPPDEQQSYSAIEQNNQINLLTDNRQEEPQ